MPSGGNPSGSTGSTSTTSTTKLNQIISTYSSITDIKTPTYPGNTYPVPNMPTGANPGIPNTTPLTISTQQATPSDANRNNISADYVKLIAASDAHQNAVKAITNLLAIIDQAKANKAQAEQNLVTYSNAYNQAVNNQRTVQNSIITI